MKIKNLKGLLCLLALHVSLTTAIFDFQFELQSISTNGNCFGDDLTLGCETYLGVFCLRQGPRSDFSTSTTDCVLGTSGRFGPGGDLPITRQITSFLAWTGSFQMFIRALDEDNPGNDDDLDDIFINSTLQPNGVYSTARDYTGQNDRVTVRMRFRVSCQSNYYGSDCVTFCVPQDDDDFGHYTCGSDGSRVCLSGYEHPENNCRDRITACSQFPCQQDAPCTAIGVVDFMCDCPPGFTSKDCSVNINECDTDPCFNDGNCTDGVASYSCTCPPGYSGTNCEVNVNECEELNVSCPGNSTCVDGIDSYSCVCNDGFVGENCTEIDPCNDNQCANGCTCTSMGPLNYQCLCPPTTLPIDNEEVSEFGSTTIVTRSISHTESPQSTVDTTQPVGASGAVTAAVGGVLGVMVFLVLVVVIVLIVLCVLKKNRKKTLYELTEATSRNGTLKDHEPTSEDHIYQTANGVIYNNINESSLQQQYETAEVYNPLYGSNSTSPLHDHTNQPPSTQVAQTSLTIESARSTDTLHDVANPLYGDSPAHLHVPGSPHGPIYSVPKPASEEAKREAENYPYSYASVATGRGTSVKGGAASGSTLVKTETPAPNYEYIKMDSAQPLSPSLNVTTNMAPQSLSPTTNEAPQSSVYNDDFHYAVIDAKSVVPPTEYKEPDQQTPSPKQTPTRSGENGNPTPTPKPSLQNSTPLNDRTNGSINVVVEEEIESGVHGDKVNSYDRLVHGTETSTPTTGMTIRLAKMEGSGYETLQST